MTMAMAMAMATSLCTSAAPHTLASRTSELSGRGAQSLCSCSQKISFTGPFLVQPRASRVCDLTGKKANNGYRVSFSNHRTKHLQFANLQYKRLWWEEGKRFVKLRLSCKALKTVEKKGLQVMAKEAGINLADY